MSKCQSVKVHHQICRFELLKYIYILNIIYRRFFAPEMSLTLWHFDTFDTFELFRILNINQLQGSPMYSKSVRPIFWWKNGRADDRKSRLFGALRIVLGLHLSICGVVDLPIIGSNLVKTGVQDAIFDRFWWSFIWNAKVGRFVHVAPKYVFLSATPQLLCDIAKITNFLLFCKKIPY